jgi:hypothetical protein
VVISPVPAHPAPAAALAALDELVTAPAAPFAALIARMVTILRIGQRTAEAIVKTGGDTARLPPALGAWAASPRRWPSLTLRATRKQAACFRK